jgi:hypothetical protein
MTPIFCFSRLSGIDVKKVEQTISDLSRELGILEWNDRFKRYEIISDAVPRSAFNRFLERKVKQLEAKKINDLFVKHAKKLVDLPYFKELDPEFSNVKDIRTGEWRFKTFFSHEKRIHEDLQLAICDWKRAIEPDSPKGQLIYYYLTADALIDEEIDRINKHIKKHLFEQKADKAPYHCSDPP